MVIDLDDSVHRTQCVLERLDEYHLRVRQSLEDDAVRADAVAQFGARVRSLARDDFRARLADLDRRIGLAHSRAAVVPLALLAGFEFTESRRSAQYRPSRTKMTQWDSLATMNRRAFRFAHDPKRTRVRSRARRSHCTRCSG